MAKTKALAVTKKITGARTFDAYEICQIRSHEVASEAYEQFVQARQEGTPPWRVDELSSGYRVVSSNGSTLAWIYSAEGIERSADPTRPTR